MRIQIATTAAAASLCCDTAVVVAAAVLPFAVHHMPDGQNCCWFIVSDRSVFSIQTMFTFDGEAPKPPL